MLQKCLLCGRVFQIKEHQAHFPICEKKRTISCELCPMKFEFTKYLGMHMRNVHRQKLGRKRVLKTEKQDQNQVKDTMEKTIIKAEKTTELYGPEISSSSLNVVEDRDISTTKKDIADNSVHPLVENPSSTSSGTKCTQCGKECATGYNLSQHILKAHHLTECSICGITLKGYTQARQHKVCLTCLKLIENSGKDCFFITRFSQSKSCSQKLRNTSLIYFYITFSFLLL